MPSESGQFGEAGQKFARCETGGGMGRLKWNQGRNRRATLGDDHLLVPASLAHPLAGLKMKFADGDGSHVHNVHSTLDACQDKLA